MIVFYYVLHLSCSFSGSILYLLHRVGALRCLLGSNLPCQAGCSAEGSNHGIEPENVVPPETPTKQGKLKT